MTYFKEPGDADIYSGWMDRNYLNVVPTYAQFCKIHENMKQTLILVIIFSISLKLVHFNNIFKENVYNIPTYLYKLLFVNYIMNHDCSIRAFKKETLF